MDDLETMFGEIQRAFSNIELKMSTDKTKIMSPTDGHIQINGEMIESVDHYVYLGHDIKLEKENQTIEITMRTGLTWAAIGRLRYIFRNLDVPLCLTKQVYKSCVLPVATYGLETATWLRLTEKNANRLKVKQKAMDVGNIFEEQDMKRKYARRDEGYRRYGKSGTVKVAMGWTCCQSKSIEKASEIGELEV